ncbi:MAG TPA: LysR family transcriptional regulator [Streptosporangiales bacterium]
MELADIEAFLVLAEELHFARTAARMHVSPARVSQRIQALEHELGGSLFLRTSRRVALTPLGVQLRVELAPAYRMFGAALDHARDTARSPSGVLHIGFTATTASDELDRLVITFERRHPGCQIVMHEVPIMDPLGPLRGGEIDVLTNWLALDDPDLTLGPSIGDYARVLAVAAHHPLATHESVSAEVLADYPVTNWHSTTFPESMLRAIVPDRTPSGRPIRRHPTPVHTMGEGASLIARGHVIHPTMTALSHAFTGHGIAMIPISDLAPLPLGLIWVTAHDNNRIRALAAVARQLATSVVYGPKPTG